MTQEAEPSTIPREVARSAEIYWWWAVRLQRTLIGLTIVSTLASIFVATCSDSIGSPNWHWTVKAAAFVAAASSALTGALGLPQRNSEMWRAWRKLNGAIVRHTYDPSFTQKDLLAVWQRVEDSLPDLAQPAVHATGSPTSAETAGPRGRKAV